MEKRIHSQRYSILPGVRLSDGGVRNRAGPAAPPVLSSEDGECSKDRARDIEQSTSLRKTRGRYLFDAHRVIAQEVMNKPQTKQQQCVLVTL